VRAEKGGTHGGERRRRRHGRWCSR